jgi:ubiquitin thioesterase OTU1
VCSPPRPATLQVRGGFPPKLLAFPADEAAATVASLGLQSGDSLTVSQLPAGGAAAAASPPSNGHQVAAEGAPAPAAGVGGLSEDEQLARAIALSLGQAVPDLPPPAAASGGAAGLRAATAAATAPAAASARVAAPQRRAASPVRAHPASSAPSAAAAKQQQGAPIAVPLPDGTAVMRRIVDSDNSCLFNAIGYVTERSRKRAPLLRWVELELLHMLRRLLMQTRIETGAQCRDAGTHQWTLCLCRRPQFRLAGRSSQMLCWQTRSSGMRQYWARSLQSTAAGSR